MFHELVPGTSEGSHYYPYFIDEETEVQDAEAN